MTYRESMITLGRRQRPPLTIAILTAILAATALLANATPALAQVEHQRGLARDPNSPVDLAPYYSQNLTWSACEGGRQCAQLRVPLDYGDAAAGDITVALSRVLHSSSVSQGSLIVNPGGPGGSGLDFATVVADEIAPTVAKQFDIVGFDPRGVGKSAPVTCMTGAQTTRWILADPTPVTRAEQEAYMRLASTISTGCLRYSPTIAPHVQTSNTVKDMDIMRAALGEANLNLLGFSYGTSLGALYAQEFPDKVGRMVLDGAVDTSLDGMAISLGQSNAFQQALVRFANDCGRHADCPTRDGKQAVISNINRLLASLNQHTLPSTGYEPLNQAQAITAIFLSMYSPSFWAPLRLALAAANKGSGTDLQKLADLASDRDGKNHYASNQNSAFLAISCIDAPATPGRLGLLAAANSWSRSAPVPEMARAIAWGNAPCSTWFAHPKAPLTQVASTTKAPILIVDTRYDPATPYAWGVAVHKALPTSSLLTYEGDGHTAYGGGSACIDAAVDTYLLSGVVPPPNKTCT